MAAHPSPVLPLTLSGVAPGAAPVLISASAPRHHRRRMGAGHLLGGGAIAVHGVLAEPGMKQRVEHEPEDHHAEGDDGVALLVEQRVQEERREHRGPGPQDEDRAPRAMSQAQEPVVDVVLVGRVEARALRRAADEGECHVGDGHSQDEHRDEQRCEEEVGLSTDVGGPATDEHGGCRQQEAEEQGSGVSHEGPGGVEVVGQEPDAHPEGHHRDERAEVVGGEVAQEDEAQAVDGEQRPEAMATMPVASPSRPSMRFTALVITMTHNAVNNGVTSGDRTKNPTNGILNWNMVTPKNTRTMAASTWPAILAGADISLTSSMNPTTKMTPAPSTNPRGSEDPAKSPCSWPSCDATKMATRKARNMATPPP